MSQRQLISQPSQTVGLPSEAIGSTGLRNRQQHSAHEGFRAPVAGRSRAVVAMVTAVPKHVSSIVCSGAGQHLRPA